LGLSFHMLTEEGVVVYEKFSGRARKVMQLAHQEVQRLNHAAVGTEHILLGLVKVREGAAAVALNNLGVDLRMLRSEVEKLNPRNNDDSFSISRPPPTPQAARAIQNANAEAKTSDVVSTAHLLFGVLSVNAVASQALEALGLSTAQVREEVIKVQHDVP